MTTDRDESGLIRSWLDETYKAERDAQPFLDRVLDDVPNTPQRRRRWWHLPTLRRTPAAPTTKETTEYQPAPTPALNGHTPTVTGRTTSMLSPVKAITAVVLAFAIGGVFLITQPFGGTTDVAPGAATDTGAPEAAWVTGTIGLGNCILPESEEVSPEVVRLREHCAPQRWTMSDSRLSGTATETWYSDSFPTDPVSLVQIGRNDVQTEDGAWVCTFGPRAGQGTSRGVSKELRHEVCIGSGSNDGLTAVLTVDLSEFTVEGLIFSGELPPMPDAPAE